MGELSCSFNELRGNLVKKLVAGKSSFSCPLGWFSCRFEVLVCLRRFGGGFG